MRAGGRRRNAVSRSGSNGNAERSAVTATTGDQEKSGQSRAKHFAVVRGYLLLQLLPELKCAGPRHEEQKTNVNSTNNILRFRANPQAMRTMRSKHKLPEALLPCRPPPCQRERGPIRTSKVRSGKTLPPKGRLNC